MPNMEFSLILIENIRRQILKRIKEKMLSLWGVKLMMFTSGGMYFSNVPPRDIIMRSMLYLSKSNNGSREMRLFSAPPQFKESMTNKTFLTLSWF